MKFIVAALLVAMAATAANANFVRQVVQQECDPSAPTLDSCQKQDECFDFSVNEVTSGCEGVHACLFEVCATFNNGMRSDGAQCKCTVSHLGLPTPSQLPSGGCFSVGDCIKDDDVTDTSYCVTVPPETTVPILIKDGNSCDGGYSQPAAGTEPARTCSQNAADGTSDPTLDCGGQSNQWNQECVWQITTPSCGGGGGGGGDQCETAFAKTSNCFIGEGTPTIKRWGWWIEAVQGTSTTYDVLAGAGQCTGGTNVGTVTVDYPDAGASGPTVTYNWNVGVAVEETHVYIGTTPLPEYTKKNGAVVNTVAPGKYEELSNDPAGGTAYVIAHAAVCF